MYQKERGLVSEGCVPYAIWRFIYVVSSVQINDQKYTTIKFDPSETVTDPEHLEAFQLIFHTFIEVTHFILFSISYVYHVSVEVLKN